jgi:hypothetical protein
VSSDNLYEHDNAQSNILKVKIPFIWPEARIFANKLNYANTPPSGELLLKADLISGLFVGAAEGTIQWLEKLLKTVGKKHICLLLILYPAGPTRQEHLWKIYDLQKSCGMNNKMVETRLYPMNRKYRGDCEIAVLPPTVIQAHDSKTSQTVMSIGSIGDSGFSEMFPGSINIVFQPDDAMRNEWRRWFQYIFSSAAPLTEETLLIPHLIPAQGTEEARLLWEKYEHMCKARHSESEVTPTVDLETGEVKTDIGGEKITPWDGGKTALNPLANLLQKVYSNGWLVTVDEATRIKPLAIPVKATLLGQESERFVGALKHKQSFTLQVLDDSVDKAIEKCRKITDLMELLTFPLSQGNRWISDRAKSLLDKEIESKNKEGHKILRKALGDKNVKQFIESRTEAIRKNLNEMYRQLGQGNAVPADKLITILDEIELRLKHALDRRITPRTVYNQIAPPDLTEHAPDDNWKQPLSLLVRSARVLRECLSNPFRLMKIQGLSFSVEDLRGACNVFDDAIIIKPDMKRAKAELDLLNEINNDEKSAKESCQGVWQLIKGDEP